MFLGCSKYENELNVLVSHKWVERVEDYANYATTHMYLRPIIRCWMP